MKRGISFYGMRFGRLYAIVFISALLIIVSCKSEEVKKLEKFTGEYDVYFDWCNNSSLFITGSGYLEVTKRKTDGKGVELLFQIDKNTYTNTATWFGNVLKDTVFIYTQTPLSNPVALYNPNYTVSGYGVIRGDSIKFAIDQRGAGPGDGICTFSAKRK